MLPLVAVLCRYYVPNPAYAGASWLPCFGSAHTAATFPQHSMQMTKLQTDGDTCSIAPAGAAGKAAWQQVQYGAGSSRRRTISTAGRSPQHLQQQVSSQLSQQQQHLVVQQQSSYGTTFDQYSSSNAYTAGYNQSHDFTAAGGCRDSDSCSDGSACSGSSGCSSSRSVHVSIRMTRSAGGAAASSAAAAAAEVPRELELLKGVSGFAVPGKLMALMGGSGAGMQGL